MNKFQYGSPVSSIIKIHSIITELYQEGRQMEMENYKNYTHFFKKYVAIQSFKNKSIKWLAVRISVGTTLFIT
jgi:hypothetical protein